MNITVAQALSVTIAVSGANGDPAPTGSVILTSGNYTSPATNLNGGSATINIPAGSLAIGANTLKVSYGGDNNFSPNTGSASVTVTEPVNPSFTVSGTAVTVVAGSTAANSSTITVTPVGGFTGSVSMTAAVTSSPSGAQHPPSLSFGSTSPVGITSSAAATADLAVFTTAATSAAVEPANRRGTSWYGPGGAVLACLLLFGVRSTRRTLATFLGMLMLLISLAGSVLACGGGGSRRNGSSTVSPGTTAGNYTVTVTGTSGTTAVTGIVILIVR
jgi:hypothetical protein